MKVINMRNRKKRVNLYWRGRVRRSTKVFSSNPFCNCHGHRQVQPRGNDLGTWKEGTKRVRGICIWKSCIRKLAVGKRKTPVHLQQSIQKNKSPKKNLPRPLQRLSLSLSLSATLNFLLWSAIFGGKGGGKRGWYDQTTARTFSLFYPRLFISFPLPLLPLRRSSFSYGKLQNYPPNMGSISKPPIFQLRSEATSKQLRLL